MPLSCTMQLTVKKINVSYTHGSRGQDGSLYFGCFCCFVQVCAPIPTHFLMVWYCFYAVTFIALCNLHTYNNTYFLSCQPFFEKFLNFSGAQKRMKKGKGRAICPPLVFAGGGKPAAKKQPAFFWQAAYRINPSQTQAVRSAAGGQNSKNAEPKKGKRQNPH